PPKILDADGFQTFGFNIRKLTHQCSWPYILEKMTETVSSVDPIEPAYWSVPPGCLVFRGANNWAKALSINLRRRGALAVCAFRRSGSGINSLGGSSRGTKSSFDRVSAMCRILSGSLRAFWPCGGPGNAIHKRIDRSVWRCGTEREQNRFRLVLAPRGKPQG